LAAVDAANFPIAHPDEDDSKAVEARLQALGTSCYCGSIVVRMSPEPAGMGYGTLKQVDSSYRLVSRYQREIPSPIPISLLKVAIVVERLKLIFCLRHFGFGTLSIKSGEIIAGNILRYQIDA